MTEQWVLDASPLILLGKAGELGWLPKMGQLVIPQSVAVEIGEGSVDDPARQWLNGSAGDRFIQQDCAASDELKAWDLGAGETAVLAWAMQHRGYEAVLDDSTGRAGASVFGVVHRGTLSLVALAKKRGLLHECRPVFRRLQNAGLYVTPAILEQVAKAAGEG